MLREESSWAIWRRAGSQLHGPGQGKAASERFRRIRIHPPASRNAVREELAEQGIPGRIYFPPIHLQRPFREAFAYRPGDFPAAEQLGSEHPGVAFFRCHDQGASRCGLPGVAPHAACILIGRN
ncbi:MAG: DegT/DnrJ/EryC1/StrS family aminotransferase [Acidobacteriota bacterium]